MQLGTKFAFSPWQPIETTLNEQRRPAQTLGSFYGNLFVAELIGKQRDLQVAEFGSRLPSSICSCGGGRS